jgi:hypothetical protein
VAGRAKSAISCSFMPPPPVDAGGGGVESSPPEADRLENPWNGDLQKSIFLYYTRVSYMHRIG